MLLGTVRIGVGWKVSCAFLYILRRFDWEMGYFCRTVGYGYWRIEIPVVHYFYAEHSLLHIFLIYEANFELPADYICGAFLF